MSDKRRRSRVSVGPIDPAWTAHLDTQHFDAPFNDWAYHCTEIRAVIRDITDGRSRKPEDRGRLTEIQREYVVLRFWFGLDGPELDAHFGRPMRVPWARTKAKLAQRLAHLDPRPAIAA